MKIVMTVNGREETVDVAAGNVLLDTLRDELGLTGTKEGCREGECGACSVLVDGRIVDACIYATAAAQGCAVETVEAPDDRIKQHVQAAMIRCNGVQCGFCTPGFVMMMTYLLRHNPDPDETEIAEALAGNICRCTGYAGIMDAAREAARTLREQPGSIQVTP